jgi:hypothetical protein
METVSLSAGVSNVSSSSGGGSKAYQVGPWDQYFIRDLDGIPGDELAFVDYEVARTRVTVITHQSRSIDTYSFRATNHFQFSNLDNLNGPEVLFH